LAACQPKVVEKTVEVPKTVEVERIVQVTPTPARDVLSLPNAATGIPYEIKPSINGGKPIRLTMWEWMSQRVEYEKRWCQEYQALYPNVSIEITTVAAFNDYFAKLITNIPAKQGPTLFHMHLNNLAPFCEGNFMDPMPPYVADQAFLDAHWSGYREGLFNCAGTGTRHFVPMGAQLPVLFINRALWQEAGLTDADIPKSWEQLRRVARALTKYDNSGRIVQAGFQAEWFRFTFSGMYQQGRYLFASDHRHAQLANAEAQNALQFILDLYKVDQVFDPEFPEGYTSFTSGQTAMFMTEAFYAAVVRSVAPTMDWFGVLMPTFSGELAPAVGRKHFAVDMAVNSQATKEEKEVAWDFWHFVYSDDERLVRDLSIGQGMLPAYDKLLEHPAVKADSFAAALAPGMDYGVAIGELPLAWETCAKNAISAVLLGEASIADALKTAEAQLEVELAKRERWGILERNYKHDDLMIPNQP
ncbi:MAG: extracellular solute-binding protein, partial [Anaerolineae bacterium]|nr:extracellular solute-binding protein [Anaerolineae bacterium]